MLHAFSVLCNAGRSETLIEYDLGFDERGKVQALKVRGYFLCGAHMDLGFNDMLVLKTGADQVRFLSPVISTSRTRHVFHQAPSVSRKLLPLGTSYRSDNVTSVKTVTCYSFCNSQRCARVQQVWPCSLQRDLHSGCFTRVCLRKSSNL